MESIRSSLIRGSSVKVLLGEGGLAGAFHDVTVAVGTHPVVIEDLLQITAARKSGASTTTIWFSSKSLASAYLMALATAIADEPPTSSASSPARRRVTFKGFGVGHAHECRR